MKITYSKENINAFGGINFADYIINNAGVYSTIRKHLTDYVHRSMLVLIQI